MAVITISRENGARGNYIGQQLAKKLGYRHVGKDLIHEVCMEYGVGPSEFERIYDHAPGLLDRYEQRNREIARLIGRVIRGLARRGNIVIVGRGSFAVLRNFEDVLNVRVTAKRSVRVQRFQQDHRLNSEQARKMIDRLDNDRCKYIGAYYGLDWKNAALYDLCVNTGKLTPDQGVAFILQALAFLEENQSAQGEFARDLPADPTLGRIIDDSISLLDAAAEVQATK